MPVIEDTLVWGRIATSGSSGRVLHAWKRHRGVWLPSVCGHAPIVLDTAVLEAEEDRVGHLPRCQFCTGSIGGA